MELAELTWTYHYMDYLGGTHQYTRLQIQVVGVVRTYTGVLITILDHKYR